MNSELGVLVPEPLASEGLAVQVLVQGPMRLMVKASEPGGEAATMSALGAPVREGLEPKALLVTGVEGPELVAGVEGPELVAE